MAHPYIPNLLIPPHGVGVRSQHVNVGQEDCNTVVRIQILWQSSRESPQKSLTLGVQYVCTRIIGVLRLSLDPPPQGQDLGGHRERGNDRLGTRRKTHCGARV